MMSNFISIQDKATSNALFGGAVVYAQVRSFQLSGTNIVKTTNKTAQPTYIAADGADTYKYLRAYNRKKVQAQYSAFTNPKIAVEMIFKYDEREMTTRSLNGQNVRVLTLPDVMHIIMTPKTFYLKEPSINGQLSSGDYPYYSDYGIPVVITSWSMKTDPGSKDVSVTITFGETIDEFIGV